MKRFLQRLLFRRSEVDPQAIDPISVVICYRHKPDRFDNLIEVVNWFLQFPGEVLISELDVQPCDDLDDISRKSRVTRIFKSDSAGFNRSRAFNAGAAAAAFDTIVFADSDIVMRPASFAHSLQILQQSPILECISPWNRVIDLNPEERSSQTMEEWLSIKRRARRLTNISGGMIALMRSGFEKIGGWCEEFVGWGAEDEYMSRRIKQTITWRELPYRGYHLWHPPAQLVREEYNRNLDLLKEKTGIDFTANKLC
ncbi:galactosyltransferase-related protein [Gemmatimonadota bacterium]